MGAGCPSIAFLDVDWNGLDGGRASDVPGAEFARINLGDLCAHYGSNGFTFAKLGGSAQNNDGIVLFNAYEVNTAIVIFYTRFGLADMPLMKNGADDIPTFARLVAVSLMSPEYAKSLYGQRSYDPVYRKIEWR